MPAAAVMPKRQRFVGKLIHLSSAAMARLYMFRPSPSDLGEVGGGGGNQVRVQNTIKPKPIISQPHIKAIRREPARTR